MRKVSLSLLFSLLLLAMFATVAMAEDPAGDQDLVGGYNEELDTDSTLKQGTFEPNSNANNTGFLELKPSRYGGLAETYEKGGSRHGNYANNTNTCATCHQTHTASSKNLVFADSVYQSCIACHDGTGGGDRRNVLHTDYDFVMERNSPNEDGETATTAGIFSGTHTSNMSVHLTTGAVAIKAAPGGNPDGDGSAFTCASCHNPHGSYSDKYLHQNPNGMATVPIEEGGRRLTNVGFDNSEEFYLVRTTKTAAGLEGKGNAEFEDIIIIERKAGRNGKVRDESPWLKPNSRAGVGSEFVANDAEYTIVYEYGFIEGTEENLNKITAATKIDRAYYVDLPTNRSDLWGSGNHVLGVQASEFCASCHNDYLVSSGGSTSLWDEDKTIYGHTTNSNSYTCLRCHYAHGTTAEIMIDAKGESITSLVADGWDQQDAFNHILDANPSSALKKFTNMSSCIACHTSSKSSNIINTNRLVDDGPSGMPSGR